MTREEKEGLHSAITAIVLIFFGIVALGCLGWMGAVAMFEHRHEIMTAIAAAPLATVFWISIVGFVCTLLYGLHKFGPL